MKVFLSVPLLVSLIKAFSRSNYPSGLQVPPINTDWTAKALAGASIPNTNPRAKDMSPEDIPSAIKACNNPNDWALTYDDGPSGFTEQYALKPLKDNNVKGTFYVTGQQVVENPEILKQTYAEGHSIGIHSWSHTAISTLTNDQIVAEVLWTLKAVYDVIGVVPSHFRPPYGDIDARSAAVVEALGMKIVIWNVDTLDWQVPQFQAIIKPVNDHIQRKPMVGAISLEHDILLSEAIHISPVLDVVKRSSYTLTTVPDCVGFAPYGLAKVESILGLIKMSDPPSPPPPPPPPPPTSPTSPTSPPPPTSPKSPYSTGTPDPEQLNGTMGTTFSSALLIFLAFLIFQ